MKHCLPDTCRKVIGLNDYFEKLDAYLECDCEIRRKYEASLETVSGMDQAIDISRLRDVAGQY